MAPQPHQNPVLEDLPTQIRFPTATTKVGGSENCGRLSPLWNEPVELINAGLFIRVELGKKQAGSCRKKKRESEPLIKEIFLTLPCVVS